MTSLNPKPLARRVLQVKPSIRSVWVMVLLIFVLDMAFKSWVHQQLDYLQVIAVTPFFNLVHVHNTGAAFSFLADAGGWQRWLFVGVAGAISLWLAWSLSRSSSRLERFAFASLLGGALGNMVDRLFRGYVVDYLDLYWQTWHWPAFNLADMAICAGAVLLVWHSFKTASPNAIESKASP